MDKTRAAVIGVGYLGRFHAQKYAQIAGCELAAVVDGCVANTTASRVSLKTERKLRIFEDAAYISPDLQQKILTLIRKREGILQPGHLPVSIEEANFEQGDALKSEIESFIDCIRNEKRPTVSGEDGLRALETAIRITEQVHANLPGNRKPA
jgi:predicted dehydrogenase